MCLHIVAIVVGAPCRRDFFIALFAPARRSYRLFLVRHVAKAFYRGFKDRNNGLHRLAVIAVTIQR